MKQQINQHELAILDKLLVAAGEMHDGLANALGALTVGIHALLLVDDSWDRNAVATIERRVRSAAAGHVEELLGQLGITVDDQFTPHR